AYAERTRGLRATDDEIRAEDMRRAVQEADRACEDKNCDPSKSRPDATREIIRNVAQKLSADRLPTASQNSREAAFFQKIEEAKNDQVTKYAYGGSSVADYMILDKREYGYAEWLAKHTEEHGYAPYISKAMVMAYALEHDLKIHFFNDSTTHEYASMLLKTNSAGQKQNEPSLEVAEAVIKQSLCFKALHDACERKEFTPEAVRMLHAKARILAEHIVKENIHVLDNGELLKEFAAAGKPGENVHKHRALLTRENCNRIAELGRIDMNMERQSQMHKMKELEQAKIDKSYDFDISR
ncbi:MAG: hypothetical protein LBG04_02815, partial [Holosporaceae bacterium]|nr:hypothetical protein [Holosporaceae bacterium]